jgi:hypothetical protein
MNKELIIDRLEMLSELISETQPEIPNDKMLFHHHTIDVLEEIQYLRDKIKNKSISIDEDHERQHIINIMKKANRYWAIRNKIKSGEWDNLEMLEVEEQIHEYLDQGSKINAIKYYRESMKTHFNRHVTLRESKDMIDALSIGKKATLW